MLDEILPRTDAVTGIGIKKVRQALPRLLLRWDAIEAAGPGVSTDSPDQGAPRHSSGWGARA
eukprot:12997506-Alexandrium_andersonii.AAC.1